MNTGLAFQKQQGFNMSKTKARKIKNNTDLLNNYVWCEAGSSKRYKHGCWIHIQTCRARQAKKDNNCRTMCDWYKSTIKINNPKVRANVSRKIITEQIETEKVKKEILNNPGGKKYLKSIPKNDD